MAVLRDPKATQRPSVTYQVEAASPARTPATTTLVALCVAVSVIGWLIPNGWYIQEGTVGRTGVLVQHEWWRLATSVFLHANIYHLIVNMFALWIMGRDLETALGTRRFLIIYFAAALGGDVLVVTLGAEHTIGASGAIYGIMGAVLCLGWRAWSFGYRKTGKKLATIAGLLVAINLFALRESWALTEHSEPGVYFSYDATTGRSYYNGPARFAIEAGYTSPEAWATSARKDVWPQYVQLSFADPDSLIVSCPVPETAPSMPFRASTSA